MRVAVGVAMAVLALALAAPAHAQISIVDSFFSVTIHRPGGPDANSMTAMLGVARSREVPSPGDHLACAT